MAFYQIRAYEGFVKVLWLKWDSLAWYFRRVFNWVAECLKAGVRK